MKSARHANYEDKTYVKSVYNSSFNCFENANGYYRSAKCNGSFFTYESFRENHAFERSGSHFRTTSTTMNGYRNSVRDVPPVELVVTNLDPSFDQISLRKELTKFFRDNEVRVHHVSVLSSPHSPHTSMLHGFESSTSYSLKAIVKVATAQDAQVAVSKLHRYKLGSKRIIISNLNSDRSPPLPVLKSEVTSIFDDIPSKKLPMVTFQEIFEKRYHRSLCMAVIHKLRDVIHITNESENGGGRFVVLNPFSKYKKVVNNDQLTVDSPYCTIHTQKEKSDSWMEQEHSLPLVHISLKTLAAYIHTLLDTHGGSLPLNSIVDCYVSEFGREFDTAEPRVPLEHLISCLPGIEVTWSKNLSFKKIQWSENKLDLDENVPIDVKRNGSSANSASEGIAKALTQFSREVKDLLKSQSHCVIPFSKFVPAYHNHFGRQCCVYQYGYTKLIDLLEAVSHVVQILGDGQKRMLTLTHREQTKRFAADLLKVLKIQPGKRLALKQFPELFETVLEKHFDVADYGVCYVTDILQDVWEGTVVMKQDGDDIVIEIPKREQTEEEMKRTKMFAGDVRELLQSTPNFAMAFCKFIPAYHHYFGRQCKVSDYGFAKLIELLEAISPNVIEVLVASNGEDRFIRLNLENRLRAIAYRLIRIVKSQANGCISLDELQSSFRKNYGFGINYEDFDAHDMLSLLKKMPATFDVKVNNNQGTVKLFDDTMSDVVRKRILRILMEDEDCKKQMDDLLTTYKSRFNQELDVFVLHEKMRDCIDIEHKLNCVSLTPAQRLIRDCILAFQSTSLKYLTLRQLRGVYEKRFGKPLQLLKEAGCRTLEDLLYSRTDFLDVFRRAQNGKITWFLTLKKEVVDDEVIFSSSQETSEESTDTDEGLSSGSETDKVCSPVGSYVTGGFFECSGHNSTTVPLPPNEWLPEIKDTKITEVSWRKKFRRIVAKFDLIYKDGY